LITVLPVSRLRIKINPWSVMEVMNVIHLDTLD